MGVKVFLVVIFLYILNGCATTIPISKNSCLWVNTDDGGPDWDKMEYNEFLKGKCPGGSLGVDR